MRLQFYSALRALWSTKEPSSLAPPHIDVQVLKGLARPLPIQPFSMIVKGKARTNFIHLNRTDDLPEKNLPEYMKRSERDAQTALELHTPLSIPLYVFDPGPSGSSSLMKKFLVPVTSSEAAFMKSIT